MIWQDKLEALNLACRIYYSDTNLRVKGYRLFLREFIPSDENDLLVAIALGWPEESVPKECRRWFYSVVGCETTGEYNIGDKFDISQVHIKRNWLDEERLSRFIEERDAAMKRLTDYIEEHA